MGGAKNCPETPRQKMIGMMYLVLTAMLALNVSTDILNGFKLVDDSLHASVEATEHRNKGMLNLFEEAVAVNPEKNQEWYDKALEMTAKSDSLYNYIQEFKYNMVKLVDGDETDPEVRNVVGTSNLDVTGQYGIEEGNGAILREKINAYREYLISLAPSHANEFNTLFATNGGKTNDGYPISWEATLFEGMPVGASITLLTKIQNDVRTAQSEMIQYLQIATDASDLRVNKMEALVIPESKYVLQGSKYSAKIVLAAVDTTQKPTYYINGSQINDQGVYEFTASGLGAHKYTGHILVKGPDGEEATYPFESSYNVGEPSATISNTDLNVMYRDYDNKFSISVPGVASNNIRVTVDGASVKQDKGLWLIRPTSKANELTIMVAADMGGGKYQSMGSQKYRVKALPKPGAYFKSGSKEYDEGNIARAALLNGDATIIASYGPDGLLDLKYTITSFTLRTARGLKPAKGNKFTAAQINELKQLKPGSLVNIVEIRAKNASGKEVTLRGIPLILN